MKNVKNAILLVVLLFLVGAAVYYLWPEEQVVDPIEAVNLFEFKVIKEGLADWKIEDYKQRFEAARESLELNPDQLDGWIQLGMIKKHLGDYEGAEAAWIAVAQYRPFNSVSYNNLADLYINFSKEYDKVEPVLRKAIENSIGEAKNSMFYRNFYYFYKDNLEDIDKAEEILLEGVENNPKSDLLSLAGSFYKEQGDIQKAIEYYEKYLAEVNPDNDVIKRQLDKLKK